MGWYHVYEEISGDSGDFNTDSPKQAAIEYLKKDTEPNPRRKEWGYWLTICRTKKPRIREA